MLSGEIEQKKISILKKRNISSNLIASLTEPHGI